MMRKVCLDHSHDLETSRELSPCDQLKLQCDMRQRVHRARRMIIIIIIIIKCTFI